MSCFVDVVDNVNIYLLTTHFLFQFYADLVHLSLDFGSNSILSKLILHQSL